MYIIMIKSIYSSICDVVKLIGKNLQWHYYLLWIHKLACTIKEPFLLVN